MAHIENNGNRPAAVPNPAFDPLVSRRAHNDQQSVFAPPDPEAELRIGRRLGTRWVGAA